MGTKTAICDEYELEIAAYDNAVEDAAYRDRQPRRRPGRPPSRVLKVSHLRRLVRWLKEERVYEDANHPGYQAALSHFRDLIAEGKLSNEYVRVDLPGVALDYLRLWRWRVEQVMSRIGRTGRKYASVLLH